MADAEAVAAAVVRALPAAEPVTSIQRIEQGWGNESWDAASALGRIVAKVGLPPGDVPKWRASAAGLDLARGAGVPAPEMLAFVERAEELDGRILRIFRYISGRTAGPDEPLELFRELGAAVRRLHSVVLPQFTSRVGTTGFDRWSDFLAHRWAAVYGRVEQARIDTAFAARVERLASSLAAEVDEVATPVLCHRDLYLDNVLVDHHGSLVALLDFDMVEGWDPMVEFFKLDWFVFEPRPQGREPFMDGYLDGDPLPPKFEHRVRLATLVELMNHAANWRLSGHQDGVADQALARLAALLEDRDV